jgi:hypothetical protein
VALYRLSERYVVSLEKKSLASEENESGKLIFVKFGESFWLVES